MTKLDIAASAHALGIISLAAYAFWVSLAAQPAFGVALLDEE
jgi:hypothetical protein